VHRIDEEHAANSKFLTAAGGGRSLATSDSNTQSGPSLTSWVRENGRLSFLLAASCSPRTLPAGCRSLFPPRDRGRGNYRYARFKGVGSRMTWVCARVCDDSALYTARLRHVLTRGCGVRGTPRCKGRTRVYVSLEREESRSAARFETVDERLSLFRRTIHTAHSHHASRPPLIFDRGPTVAWISSDNTVIGGGNGVRARAPGQLYADPGLGIHNLFLYLRSS